MRERDIQGKVVGYARSRGVMARKLDFGQGWPDFMFLRNGCVLFIEFKGAGGRLRPLQIFVHAQLAQKGFEVEVVEGILAGEAIIEKFIARADKAVVHWRDTIGTDT